MVDRMRSARVLIGIATPGLALLATFAAPVRAEKPDVSVRLIAPESAAAGTRVPVAVEMTVGPGWHVNSHTPAEKFLIPTDVDLSATAGTLSPVRYPPHVERRFEFAGGVLRVYEGTVRFETELALPADAGGQVTLAGTVRFQACNERQCFPPSKIPVEVKLTATTASAR
jgi:thiol:disulfide interchange protein DsbD